MKNSGTERRASARAGRRPSPPAMAQSNADVLKEIQALKDRVTDLEAKLKAATEAKPPAARPASRNGA